MGFVYARSVIEVDLEYCSIGQSSFSGSTEWLFHPVPSF